MNRCLRFLSASGFVAALAVRAVAAEPTSAGYIDFGKFLPPENAGAFVEVNIRENLLRFAATLAKDQEPDVAKLLSGLHLVRVNVVGIDDKNREELAARIAKARAELDARGWERTVSVRDHGNDVAVFVKTAKGNVIEGLVVTVIDAQKEAVFVNIVGNIDAEQIATLAAKFDIPQLKDLPCARRAKPAPEATPAAQPEAAADAS